MKDEYIIESGQSTVNKCGCYIRVLEKETGDVVFKCDSIFELHEWLTLEEDNND